MKIVAAQIEGHARRQLLRVGAPTDAVRGLKPSETDAPLAQGQGRTDAGRTGADDRDLHRWLGLGHLRLMHCEREKA